MAGQGGASGQDRFVFAVPLIARAAAADWSRIEALCTLTLRSVLAQTDARFELILAGHDRPGCWDRLTRGDARFSFLEADWDPEAPTVRNDDAGMKKWRIKERVQASGGGLMMYLDADDLIDRRLVATARRAIGADRIGGVVAHGALIDFQSWRAVPLPDPRVYDGAFHTLCGSTTVARITPASADEFHRDPHEALGSHHVWPERAQALGLRLASLPLWGGYLVNTSENHSELHGPHADWRRALNAAVVRHGAPLSPDLSERLGLAEQSVG